LLGCVSVVVVVVGPGTEVCSVVVVVVPLGVEAQPHSDRAAAITQGMMSLFMDVGFLVLLERAANVAFP
jgi:hypothetical protein